MAANRNFSGSSLINGNPAKNEEVRARATTVSVPNFRITVQVLVRYLYCTVLYRYSRVYCTRAVSNPISNTSMPTACFYWFVLQCNEGDTKAIFLNIINTHNEEKGSTKIIGFKFWAGQHPNETTCRDTVLIKFVNHTCTKKCGQIFGGRIVILSFANSSNDEKTRTFLMHGSFVNSGQYLKDIVFRKLKKIVKNEVLEQEQPVLSHAACTRELEVTAKLLGEEEKLNILIKEREVVFATVTDLQLTASLLHESIIEESKRLEATRKELNFLGMRASQQGSAGDRVLIGKRGLDTAAGPCYPVHRKQSEYAPGLGLFATRDIYPNEAVARMDNPLPVSKAQEERLSTDHGYRHDSMVSMGPENNSVWDMNVSKPNIDGNPSEEPMWFYMNHKKEANANVFLYFESKNGMRFPVWKAKRTIKAKEELCYEYGIVPDSFTD